MVERITVRALEALAGRRDELAPTTITATTARAVRMAVVQCHLDDRRRRDGPGNRARPPVLLGSVDVLAADQPRLRLRDARACLARLRRSVCGPVP